MLYNKDDSPLYLFEARLDNNPTAKQMIQDYKPCDFFNNIFVELVSKN